VTSGDFERAVDLVQARAMPMLMQGQLPTLLGWFEQLPDKIIHSRPWLSMYRAWALLLTGQIDSIEPDLQCALQPPTSTDLRGHATSIRSYAAAILGNAARAKELARQALGLLSADELTVRSVVTFVLAGIYVLDQDVVRASLYFAEASQLGLQAGNLHLAVSAAGRVAAMQVLQGELPAAADSYRHTLQMAAEHSGQRSPTAGQAHSGLGSILFEWNDLEGAERHLQQAVEQNKLWGNVESLANSLVNFARLRQVQGDWVGSRELLQQAERAIQQHTVIPLTTSTIAAAWPQLWLAQGDLSAATQWVVDRQISPDDHLDFVREAEYRTLARVLLAQKRTADAIGLLNRMRAAADHTGRTGTATEILSLLSVAYWTHGDTPTAMTTLREALVHAAPGGYVRTFVDQGPPMKDLLGGIGDQHPKVNRQYVQELLSALEAETNGGVVSVGPMAPLSDKATPSLRPTAQPLPEPLSQRELEVLRLVTAGLTNREIAERLFIAVSTVKSHTNHIYGKLAVKNRTQAIAKAQALDLL